MFANGTQENLALLVAKAWADPAFKARLKAEPKTVLSEMKIDIPGGVEIEVLENTPAKMYLTLPATPSSVRKAKSVAEASEACPSCDRPGSLKSIYVPEF